MEKQVGEYVAACSVCTRNKVSRHPPQGLLRPLPVPYHPWSDISLNFVTGLLPSEGNTTILTVVDRFSKMIHFIPLPKLPSAKETAEVMLVHMLRLHGFPRHVVSDGGAPVHLPVLEGILRPALSHSQSVLRVSPQCNDQAERLNQKLETGLCCLVSQNLASWSKHLMWVEYTHNTLPCSSSGLSPFQCVYQPPLFP